MLSLPWAQVQSLIRELRSRKLRGAAKKKKERKEKKKKKPTKQEEKKGQGINWSQMGRLGVFLNLLS